MKTSMDWKEAAQNIPKPSGGGYMKLKGGANKFRILSAPIGGYLFWTIDNKPIRVKEYPTSVPQNIQPSTSIKFFWTFVVWSFADKKLQILELTQVKIINAIRDLINSEDWGDPRNYTLTINRKGEKLETEYSVMPSPSQPIPKEVTKLYEEAAINLDALYEGGNPFGDKTDGVVGDFDTEIPM